MGSISVGVVLANILSPEISGVKALPFHPLFARDLMLDEYLHCLSPSLFLCCLSSPNKNTRVDRPFDKIVAELKPLRDALPVQLCRSEDKNVVIDHDLVLPVGMSLFASLLTGVATLRSVM